MEGPALGKDGTAFVYPGRVVRRYDGCDVVGSQIQSRHVRAGDGNGEVLRLQHQYEHDLSVVRLYLDLLQPAPLRDVGEVKPFLHEREFQLCAVIFPSGSADAAGVDVPVHGVQHGVLVRDVKRVAVVLQIARHAGPARELPRITFIFLQGGKPCLEDTHCLLQVPL